MTQFVVDIGVTGGRFSVHTTNVVWSYTSPKMEMLVHQLLCPFNPPLTESECIAGSLSPLTLLERLHTKCQNIAVRIRLHSTTRALVSTDTGWFILKPKPHSRLAQRSWLELMCSKAFHSIWRDFLRRFYKLYVHSYQQWTLKQLIRRLAWMLWDKPHRQPCKIPPSWTFWFHKRFVHLWSPPKVDTLLCPI